MRLLSITRTCALALALSGAFAAEAGAQTLEAVKVMGGFASPVYVCAPPGDASRLFVVQQLVPGQQVNGEYWSRDPQASYTTNLSDAVQFTICN